MSSLTDYLREEYSIDLEDDEVTAFSENSTPNISVPEGICMGLSVKWIQAQLTGIPMGMSVTDVDGEDALIMSNLERTKAGVVQMIHGDIGRRKFIKNHGNQQKTDHDTLKALFKPLNRIVGIDHQVGIDDFGNWTRLKELKGTYLISCKKGGKGHAIAANLKGPMFHLYDPNQFWLTFRSRDRFFEVLDQLTDQEADAVNLDYQTWAWYRIM